MNNSKAITEFKKSDKWDELTFFSIYEKNGEKWLRIVGKTERIDDGFSWKCWAGYRCSCDYQAPISELLEWGDIEYGLSLLKQRINYYDEDYRNAYPEPDLAYLNANLMVKGNDGKGSKHLHLIEVTKDTPCGNYYSKWGI